MTNVYKLVKDFKRKYNRTICFRLKKHSWVVETHLNPGEKVLYAFPAQKNDKPLDFFATCVVAVTNQRLLIGYKNLLWGYTLTSITPDLFNDLKARVGLAWAIFYIDTVKEVVELSNVDRRAAREVETAITKTMMEEKKKYGLRKIDHK